MISPQTPQDITQTGSNSDTRVGSNWFIDEALLQCQKTADVYADAMPISGKALGKGIEWLRAARRLRLEVPLIPFEAEERKVGMTDEYGYGLDTPWSVTAIEYQHGGTYDVAQDYTRALSTRRIALCVTMPSSMTPMANESADASAEADDWGSMLIWPISYFDEKKEWEFAPGVVIVPREQGRREYALASNPFLALAEHAEAYLRRGFRKSKHAADRKPMMVRYQPMMPELCARLGEEHAQKMVRESSMDALWVILGSFTAMGCHNVFIHTHSRALNVVLPDGTRAGLDPFRGQRAMRWTGDGVWRQANRTLDFHDVA